MSFLLGLTGSIGMGKSTTAQMFRDRGVPVWDADAAVHRLYAPGGAAVDPVSKIFPAALRDQAIDRNALRDILARDPSALDRLEAIVHPLVAADRETFIENHADAPLILLDIPLLFENGYQTQMHGVAVASTDAETQRRRVMARPGMTSETLALILSRQMPDAEKRERADWIIPTDTLGGARAAVTGIIKEITSDA